MPYGTKIKYTLDKKKVQDTLCKLKGTGQLYLLKSLSFETIEEW